MALQHCDALLHRHVDLIAYGHEAPGQMLVVVHHEPDGDHEIIDVVEDECLLATVDLLAVKEVYGMLSPVPQGVKVM